jgi:hypothetical protein
MVYTGKQNTRTVSEMHMIIILQLVAHVETTVTYKIKHCTVIKKNRQSVETRPRSKPGTSSECEAPVFDVYLVYLIKLS